MSRKLALIIGIGEYDDPKFAGLQAPGADVDALASVLRDPAIGGFEPVELLVNASVSEITRSIARFFKNKKRDDLLLLFFSGHGVKDDHGHLHFAAKDTEFDLISGSGVPASFVTNEMDRSYSKRQVLVLDCCYSGAFARGAKGAAGAGVGTRTAFEGTGHGRVILTASDATQYAWEDEQVTGSEQGSVFTRHLVEGLRTGAADTDANGQITVDELYDYVHTKVLDENPRQTPQKWSFCQEGELIIAQNPNPVVKPATLPEDLLRALDSPNVWEREGAIGELGRLFHGKNEDLALSAEAVLRRIAEDDTQMVRMVRLAGEALRPAASPAPVPTVAPSQSQNDTATKQVSTPANVPPRPKHKTRGVTSTSSAQNGHASRSWSWLTLSWMLIPPALFFLHFAVLVGWGEDGWHRIDYLLVVLTMTALLPVGRLWLVKKPFSLLARLVSFVGAVMTLFWVALLPIIGFTRVPCKAIAGWSVVTLGAAVVASPAGVYLARRRYLTRLSKRILTSLRRRVSFSHSVCLFLIGAWYVCLAIIAFIPTYARPSSGDFGYVQGLLGLCIAGFAWYPYKRIGMYLGIVYGGMGVVVLASVSSHEMESYLAMPICGVITLLFTIDAIRRYRSPRHSPK